MLNLEYLLHITVKGQQIIVDSQTFYDQFETKLANIINGSWSIDKIILEQPETSFDLNDHYQDYLQSIKQNGDYLWIGTKPNCKALLVSNSQISYFPQLVTGYTLFPCGWQQLENIQNSINEFTAFLSSVIHLDLNSFEDLLKHFEENSKFSYFTNIDLKRMITTYYTDNPDKLFDEEVQASLDSFEFSESTNPKFNDLVFFPFQKDPSTNTLYYFLDYVVNRLNELHLPNSITLFDEILDSQIEDKDLFSDYFVDDSIFLGVRYYS